MIHLLILGEVEVRRVKLEDACEMAIFALKRARSGGRLERNGHFELQKAPRTNSAQLSNS